MKNHPLRNYALGIAAALFICLGYANTPASAESSELHSANAVLLHTLNSEHAKAGQTVTAKLTSKATSELPKGTVLIGKVDQVQQASSNGQSELSITFDQARLKNGKEVPIKAILLAAYSPQTNFSAGLSGTYLPIQPKTVPENKAVTQKPGALKNDVEMQSSGSSDMSATFTSKEDNIKLDNGTLLQVAVARMPASGSNTTSSGTAGSM